LQNNFAFPWHYICRNSLQPLWLLTVKARWQKKLLIFREESLRAIAQEGQLESADDTGDAVGKINDSRFQHV